MPILVTAHTGRHQMPNLVPVGTWENAQFRCPGSTGPREWHGLVAGQCWQVAIGQACCPCCEPRVFKSNSHWMLQEYMPAAFKLAGGSFSRYHVGVSKTNRNDLMKCKSDYSFFLVQDHPELLSTAALWVQGLPSLRGTLWSSSSFLSKPTVVLALGAPPSTGLVSVPQTSQAHPYLESFCLLFLSPGIDSFPQIYGTAFLAAQLMPVGLNMHCLKGAFSSFKWLHCYYIPPTHVSSWL